MAKPFIKWAGGKRQMLPELRKYVPDRFGVYFEPFVGGGAMFFWLQDRGLITEAVLSDLNMRLMRTYKAVRDNVERLIASLSVNEEAFIAAHIDGTARELYEALRAEDVDARSHVVVAAWMLTINRTCFNGLYRVNKSGKFNVPYGQFKNLPLICDEITLRQASAALRGVSIRSSDFRLASLLAKKGDLVYFDPPYLPITDTSDFTTYTPGGFGVDQHRQLRDVAWKLRERGVHIIVSNAGAPVIEDLYARFDIHRVAGKRAINSKGNQRGPVGEFIIT